MTRNEARESRTGAVPGSPIALDGQGHKTGQWTEPDPHGGVMVGDYLEGERLARPGESQHCRPVPLAGGRRRGPLARRAPSV